MRRILVLVEGQTEERFIKDVLCPAMWPLGVDVVPKIAVTKRVKRGPDFKGGVTDYPKVVNDLRRLLGDTGAAAVTTFVDYYGLPSDFPGMASRPPGSPLARARHVEARWEADIGHPRFRAFLALHEFEAFLFVDPGELCRALQHPERLPQFEEIRDRFADPEDINEGTETAPSKRITRLLPAYRKTVHGPLVAGRIGLAALRAGCRHFNQWITWMEQPDSQGR